MEDEQILGQISALVDEEEQLRTRHEESPLSQDERRRVQQIEVALDQCWDLLRQRRARREFGDDPDAAGVRAAETVERYRQ
jgi:Rad3-related DNA helicase